jgi:hypothetical protein
MRDVTAVQAFMRYKKKKKSAELRGRRWSWYHECFSLQNESLTGT